LIGNYSQPFFSLFNQWYALSIFLLYLPSAWFIERFGTRWAVALAQVLTAAGLWLGYAKLPTPGIALVGIG